MPTQPTVKAPVLVQYALVLMMIVGGWFIATITPNGADFATLATAGALKGLAILLATWAVGCAAHYYQTGNAEPVAPAAKLPVAPNVPPAPPVPPVQVNVGPQA